MDKKEKKLRKEKLSEFVNFGNGKFKDSEIEELEYLVENRDELNGTTKTYTSSYKAFDSEGTYRVTEEDTYTFHADESGIRIDRDFQKHWDDGQNNISKNSFETARDILRFASKLFRK